MSQPPEQSETSSPDSAGGFEWAQNLRDLASQTSREPPMYYLPDDDEWEALQRRAEIRGMSPDILQWEEKTIHNAILVAKGLGGSELAQQSAKSWIKGITELSRLQMQIDDGERSDVSVDKVERARRDLGYLLLVASVALGERDHQSGLEEGADVQFRQFINRGHSGYESVYDFCIDRFMPDGEGDYTWVRDGAESGHFENETGQEYYDSSDLHYPGKLVIGMNPGRSLSLGLVHGLQTSSIHYRQTVERSSRTGRPIKDTLDDCNIRIDLDQHAPAGVATDIGRGSYESETYSRPGDIVGQVMGAAFPQSDSHFYDGFTPEMRMEFSNMVEYVVVHQNLIRMRVRDSGDARMPTTPEEENANFKRYLENQPQPD